MKTAIHTFLPAFLILSISCLHPVLGQLKKDKTLRQIYEKGKAYVDSIHQANPSVSREKLRKIRRHYYRMHFRSDQQLKSNSVMKSNNLAQQSLCTGKAFIIRCEKKANSLASIIVGTLQESIHHEDDWINGTWRTHHYSPG